MKRTGITLKVSPACPRHPTVLSSTPSAVRGRGRASAPRRASCPRQHPVRGVLADVGQEVDDERQHRAAHERQGGRQSGAASIASRISPASAAVVETSAGPKPRGSGGSPARAARRRRDSADDEPESSTARTRFARAHTMQSHASAPSARSPIAPLSGPFAIFVRAPRRILTMSDVSFLTMGSYFAWAGGAASTRARPLMACVGTWVQRRSCPAGFDSYGNEGGVP